MMTNLTRLKYIAHFGYGDQVPKEEGLEDEIPVFGSNGPFARTSKPNTDAPVIIVGRKGSYGKINWCPIPCFASDTTFFIDGSKTQHNLRWLYYALQTLKLDEGSNEAAVPGLNRETAYSNELPITTLQHQQEIAEYLDRETAHIDALIQAKENLLTMLAEKRQALISQAVTRGLDPNVPLKPSGVEWLGDVPEHWEVKRLKFHLKGIEQGWSPQCDNVPAEEHEWGVLKAGCVNGWEFDPNQNKRLPSNLEPLPAYEVKDRDVLMSRANTRELLGSASIAKNVRSKLMISDKIYRLDVDETNLLKEYLIMFLAIPVGRYEFEREATGASSSMQNISQDFVRNLWIPVPPKQEQLNIVAYIDSAVNKLEAIKSAADKTLGLLKERRSALITAAVTGQIEIPYSHVDNETTNSGSPVY